MHRLFEVDEPSVLGAHQGVALLAGLHGIMVANPAVVAGLLVGLVVEGHRIHHEGFAGPVLPPLGIVGDQDRIRLSPFQPRHLFIGELVHPLLIIFGIQGLGLRPVTAGAIGGEVILRPPFSQVEVAEDALLVVGLLQAPYVLLLLGQVAVAAAILLPLGVEGLFGFRVVLVMAAATIVLIVLIGGYGLGGDVPVV